MKIKIKPLSSNQCWVGKLRKTNEYRTYEEELFYLLPNNVKIPEGDLQVWYVWGFSSRGSDYDNPIKPFQDILQNKYGFNDNRIIRAIVDKHIVPKGEEFISFQILGINDRFVGEFS